MAKINLLDPAVSELIAAGEVIERPASIVKELLENAIDAGATAVTVEMKNGGITFLRITDNGCGMEREDVPTAFLRHATSKVARKEDLDQIHTLGFRGEALASIAAVTKLELMTKTADAPMGVHYVLHGGVVQECSDIGCPDGSTFVIRDLFYNVPARLKFLKKGVTEGAAVQSVVEKLALSHPEVSIKLIRDNRPVLHTPGDGTLLSAIHAVLGREFAHALIEVSYDYQGVSVRGFTVKSEKCRKSRALQNFFVNGRYVKSRTCMVALEEAYTNAKMIGKFPACVLMISLPYDQVDVNVHPAKVEVRFVQEKLVYDTLYFAIKSALTRADILTTNVNEEKTFVSRPVLPVKETSHQQQSFAKPASAKIPAQTMTAEEYRRQFLKEKPSFDHTILPKPSEPIQSAQVPKTPVKQEEEHRGFSILRQSPEEHSPNARHKVLDENDPFAFLDETSFQKKNEVKKPAFGSDRPLYQEPLKPKETSEPAVSREVLLEAKKTPVKAKEPSDLPQKSTPDEPKVRIRMIGELFKTYVLFEANDLFVMIDKHAAHERLLFEQLKESVDLRESQVLLTPLMLSLDAKERAVLLDHPEELEALGFHFKEMDGQLAVTEAPLVLHRYDLADIVTDLAEQLSNQTVQLRPEQLEELLHSMACRAAVKANDTQSLQELEALVQEVYRDERIRHCPHGRPVGVTMTRYEIEKKFGRHG